MEIDRNTPENEITARDEKRLEMRNEKHAEAEKIRRAELIAQVDRIERLNHGVWNYADLLNATAFADGARDGSTTAFCPFVAEHDRSADDGGMHTVTAHNTFHADRNAGHIGCSNPACSHRKPGEFVRAYWSAPHGSGRTLPDGAPMPVARDADTLAKFSPNPIAVERALHAKETEAARKKKLEELATDDFEENEQGAPYTNRPNMLRALARLGVRVEYNDFSGRYFVHGLPGFGPDLDDAAANELRLLMRERFGLAYGKETFGDTLLNVAHKYFKTDPPRDYFEGLRWDGRPRLATLLIEHFGADDTPYHRAIAETTLCAAVARTFRPGVKFDQMLILEGLQGLGKSQALRLLAVNDDWFTDNLPINAKPQEVIEQTGGILIAEIAEMQGYRKADIEHQKAFLSRFVDISRPAYGRYVVRRPRRFIVIGTTNEKNYLRDLTGNRRHWPVACSKVDLKGLARDRDQLWAEAVARVHALGIDAALRFDPKLYGEAAEHQTARRVENVFTDDAARLLGAYWGRICNADLFTLLGFTGSRKPTMQELELIKDAMQAIGFEKKRAKFNRIMMRGYVRKHPVTKKDDQLLTLYKNSDHVWIVSPECTEADPVTDRRAEAADGLRYLMEAVRRAAEHKPTPAEEMEAPAEAEAPGAIARRRRV